MKNIDAILPDDSSAPSPLFGKTYPSHLQELISRMTEQGFVHLGTYQHPPKTFDGALNVFYEYVRRDFRFPELYEGVRYSFVHHFLLPVEKISDPLLSGLLEQMARRPDRTAAATVLEDELRFKITADLGVIPLLRGLTRESTHYVVPYSVCLRKGFGPVVSYFVFEAVLPEPSSLN
jgi:hypothetical protein